MVYSWTTPITEVKGVGPPSARKFKKLKIHTVGDLLEHQPKSYYLPEITPMSDVKEGQHVIVQGTVISVGRHYRGKGWVVNISDGTGGIQAVWYGYYFSPVRRYQKLTLWGKYRHGHLQQPNYGHGGPGDIRPEFLAGIAGGLYGIHTDMMRSALSEVRCYAPGKGSKHALMLNDLHAPGRHENYRRALNWLKHNELLLLHLAMEARRKAVGAVSVEPLPVKATSVLSYFPYSFTEEQLDVCDDIYSDLRSSKPMNRLIHGEVGSGKTAVAFYAAMRMALAGKRTLIVCPTTILANQHYNTLKGMRWDDVSLYTGSNCKISAGAGMIIVGTHALLNRSHFLKASSLVVIDETQKFGVNIKAKLAKYNLHTLLMSATPIPRSLAMTVFGDLDLSIMRELPIKRGTVVTRWIMPGREEGMYSMVQAELTRGHQAYIVYPRISSAKEDVANAEAGFAEMNRRFASPTCTVGILTGRMTEPEKSATLKQFMSGEISVLVSTIIAEVGLDCQNATVMCVMGADRFGLSQLHQLRGRVCRSTDTAFCFLVAETTNQTSIDRLDVMEKCNDGFEIAEHDLRLRGPGDLFSFRQHGLPDLKFTDLVADYKLSCETKEEAKCMITKLDEPENVGLKEMLMIKYGDVLEIGGVG